MKVICRALILCALASPRVVHSKLGRSGRGGDSAEADRRGDVESFAAEIQQADRPKAKIPEIPLVTLHNKAKQSSDAQHLLQNRPPPQIPVMGIGVGNLQHDLIVPQIVEAMKLGCRLIDTAHASRNHHLVKQGIEQGLKELAESEQGGGGDSEAIVVHVITKVWYTHLGYERTKLVVHDILENELAHAQIRVHLLLHWPRCRDDIAWMNCEQEELDLDARFQNAGPPPHLDKDHAFLDSWRALEDSYLDRVGWSSDKEAAAAADRLASIGVSNFQLSDFQALLTTDTRALAGLPAARMAPQILQDNVWNYLFDPVLVQYCQSLNIHYQAYNVMNGILNQRHKAPLAFDSLFHIAKDVVENTTTQNDNNNTTEPLLPAQLILTWLMQGNVSAIPRTTHMEHLESNLESAAVKGGSRQLLSDRQRTRVRRAVEALLRGQDLSQPEASFVNRHPQESIWHLFWKKADTGDEIMVREGLQPGETFDTNTFPGHVFVAYDETKSQRREFKIDVSYGERQQFHIDEL